jgi:hypothetical protein
MPKAYVLALVMVAPLLFARPVESSAPPAERGDNVNAALDQALKTFSLTFDGKPFHAVMEIETAGEPYSGRIEVWWVKASKYRLAITSPKFSQVKTVNGDQVQEKNDGDFYPRWLENFVLAILDPLPMAENLRGRDDVGAPRAEPTEGSEYCFIRDGRHGGVVDEMSFGQVCFWGRERDVDRAYGFSYTMIFSNWKKFEAKRVPRTYQTKVLDEDPVVAQLTVLEELKQPDETMFTIDSPTPAEQKISTTSFSTQQGESLIEKAPEIQWPPVREGNTQGFITVYVRTDRTGQVREAFKRNADQQRELATFAIQQALNYKFKPLLADAVPQQIETTLVVHFSTSISDPIPVLSVADMAKQTISCKPNKIPSGYLPKGTVITERVAVNEKGETVDVRPAAQKCPIPCWFLMGPQNPLNKCKFAAYSVNGRTTLYKGDVEVVVP